MKAIRAPPTLRTAWSSIASRSGLRKASRNSASIRVCVAFPPAPWASVMRSSLMRGLLAPRHLDPLEDLLFLRQVLLADGADGQAGLLEGSLPDGLLGPVGLHLLIRVSLA